MLPQAKPSLKSFHQIAPQSLPPISLPPRAYPKISTKFPSPTINKDLNQFASSQIVQKLPKLFKNTPHIHYKVHCPPTVPIPNPNS